MIIMNLVDPMPDGTARKVAVMALACCTLLACVGSSTAAKPKVANPAQSPTPAAAVPMAAVTMPTTKALPERKELPLAVRETLGRRMERHGGELVFLLSSVVLLRYEEAEELAQMIVDEPKLGRPVPGDDASLNALLPSGFFVYQDALSERAKELVTAAREQDDAKLSKTFGALSETCVGCHSAYLNDELEHLEDHGLPIFN
jgi:hypothetical protein